MAEHPAESDCVFCKILCGELPATLVDEGDYCVVILDRNQAAPGHLLVIPSRHTANWHDLDERVVREMSEKARAWARVLVETLQPDGYNLLLNNGSAAGQDVFHTHLHITPRTAGDGYYRFDGGHAVLTEQQAQSLGDQLRHAFHQCRDKNNGYAIRHI